MSQNTLNQQNVLVTGGAGYIGSHTVLELISAGLRPIIFDNFSNSSRKVLERLESISGCQIETVEGDCRNLEDLQRVFAAFDVKSILHFAGLKAVGESVRLPLRYYDHNVNGFIQVLAAAVAAGVKQFVLSSSATVYAGSDGERIRETAALNPINPYGRTKLMCEEIGRDLCLSNPDISFAAMRYFNPIGAHESGMIGEAPNDIPNNLMPYITRVAIGQLEKLTIYGDDYQTKDGTGVRDYIHVVDLAKGHVQALKYIADKTGDYIFNLGTGQGTSVLELVNLYESKTGAKINYVVGSRRPGDQAIVVANPKKAEEQIGFSCRYTPSDACGHSYNWIKQNPSGY